MEAEEEEEQYSTSTLSDVLHLAAAIPQYHFPATPQALYHQLGHRDLTTEPPQYDNKMMMMTMMMLGGRCEADDRQQELLVSPQAVNTTTKASASGIINGMCGWEMESSCMGGGDNGGNVRWPRQETLTLLEIRSRLHPKFKEANQKGPLWAEISRIMAEEHGYHRSGKKCKEKFENLYKYYKKTKAGKIGRPEGKHYRFFRQLEALYGETSNPKAHQFLENTTSQVNQQGTQNEMPNELMLSTSMSSELETSSSECHQNGLTTNALMEHGELPKKNHKRHRREKKKWKVKLSEFITSEMKKIMEIQEAWFERTLKAVEHREQVMQSRREKWRKLESARRDEECRFWANEHAWIKTRYVLLTDILQKFMLKEVNAVSAKDQAAAMGGSPNGTESSKKCVDEQEEIVERECIKIHIENSRTYYGGLSSNTNASTEAHDSCFCFPMNEESLFGEHALKLI